MKQPKESVFQLLNQRMVDVKFLLNEDGTKQEKNLEIEVEVKAAPSEKKALVELTVHVNKDMKDQLFNLSIKNQGVFSWKNLTEEEVKPYLEENAPAVLLSYIRSTVTNLTLAAGLTPVVLPLLNFKNQE